MKNHLTLEETLNVVDNVNDWNIQIVYFDLCHHALPKGIIPTNGREHEYSYLHESQGWKSVDFYSKNENVKIKFGVKHPFCLSWLGLPYVRSPFPAFRYYYVHIESHGYDFAYYSSWQDKRVKSLFWNHYNKYKSKLLERIKEEDVLKSKKLEETVEVIKRSIIS